MYNEIRWEECALGKKLYTKENISKAETEWLGIPELVVLKTNRDDVGLEVVHRRYFEDEKLLCPACHSSRTRCSKIVDRKLKDLLWLDEDHKTFQIISLLFHQRYMRCDNCGQSVFPEPTEFGEKGCKFTNRLSDALADGTFQFSYKKVCQHYGVPASTASVGEVMRRRIQYRESLLPPVRTPHIISIVEVVFLGEFYPAVLGIWDGEVYCLDILRDSSEETCGAFLKTLDQKMRKDSKAKKAAKTEDRQVYERSLFPGIFDTTAQEAYMENTAAYEQLFLDADKYQAVMRALADRLYKELHDDK